MNRRRRRYRQACGGVAGRSTSMHGDPTKIHRRAVIPDLPTTIPTPTLAHLFILPASLILFDHKMLQIATHALQIVNRIISQRLTTHPTLSTQPGVISMSLSLLVLFALPHHPQITFASSHVFCLVLFAFAFACAILFSIL